MLCYDGEPVAVLHLDPPTHTTHSYTHTFPCRLEYLDEVEQLINRLGNTLRLPGGRFSARQSSPGVRCALWCLALPLVPARHASALTALHILMAMAVPTGVLPSSGC